MTKWKTFWRDLDDWWWLAKPWFYIIGCAAAVALLVGYTLAQICVHG